MVKSEMQDREEVSTLTEQRQDGARASGLAGSATRPGLVPHLGAGDVSAFQPAPAGRGKPLESVVSGGISVVAQDGAFGEGAGQGEQNPITGDIDSGQPVNEGGRGGPPRDGDGLPVEFSGEAPMDRERARGILASISNMTENEFIAQAEQDHISGHTLREIQQASEIRAAELFEKGRVKQNQWGRQSLSKKTPQVQANLERHDIGRYGVSLHLWINEARPKGDVRAPRLLASSRLPLTNEPDNYMHYTHKATADQVAEEYRHYPYRDPVAADDNAGFFRGVWLFATNLTNWEEPHIELPKNSHPLPSEKDPMEEIARRRAWGAHPDPRLFGDLGLDEAGRFEDLLIQIIRERRGGTQVQDRERSSEGELKRFDRAVELGAYEQHLPELEQRLEALLSDTVSLDRSISDPNGLLVLTHEEIGKLWGLFPETARDRAVPAQIQGFGSIWFTDTSRIPVPYSTSPDNAVTPTTFAFGATQDTLDENNRVNGTNIFLCQIPGNIGVSREAQRIAQAKVAVHEQSHSFLNAEIVNNTMLRFPSGEEISATEFRARFVEVALRNEPISYYSASYRNNGDFIRDDSGWDISVGEELGESIAAYLLGFAVNLQGDLTFNPFEDREEIKDLIHDYLYAQRISEDSKSSENPEVQTTEVQTAFIDGKNPANPYTSHGELLGFVDFGGNNPLAFGAANKEVGFHHNEERQREVGIAFARSFDLGSRGPLLEVGPGSNTFVADGIKSVASDMPVMLLDSPYKNSGEIVPNGTSGAYSNFSGTIADISSDGSILKDSQFGTIMFNGSWVAGGYNFTVKENLEREIHERYHNETGHSINWSSPPPEFFVWYDEKITQILEGAKDHLTDNGALVFASPRYANHGAGYSFQDLPSEKFEYLDIIARAKKLGATKITVLGVSADEMQEMVEHNFSNAELLSLREQQLFMEMFLPSITGEAKYTLLTSDGDVLTFDELLAFCKDPEQRAKFLLQQTEFAEKVRARIDEIRRQGTNIVEQLSGGVDSLPSSAASVMTEEQIAEIRNLRDVIPQNIARIDAIAIEFGNSSDSNQ